MFTQNYKDKKIRFLKHFSPLQGQYGFDILKECILKNDVSLIEFIELGWDIDYVSNGYNLLYFACYLNLENHVEILVKHMKQIDHPDAFPAVCSLCILGNPYIAKMILSKKIDVHRMDKKGRTGPDFLQSDSNQPNFLKILSMLYEYGYNLNFKNKSGNTILGTYLTSLHPPKVIIEWLIIHGADVNSNVYLRDKTQMPIKQYIRLNNVSLNLGKIVKKYLI